MKGNSFFESMVNAFQEGILRDVRKHRIACVSTRIPNHSSHECVGWPHAYGRLSEYLITNVCAK